MVKLRAGQSAKKARTELYSTPAWKESTMDRIILYHNPG